MFALTLQHIVEDEVAQKPGLLRTAQFDILDFAIDVALFAGQEKVASVCQKTPLSELSCHDPPHFPRQLQPNFVQEDASDRSGWGDWWWTGPDLRDAAIGRRSRLLGSGFKG